MAKKLKKTWEVEAEASFKDGVLELKVAKVNKAKRRSVKLD